MYVEFDLPEPPRLPDAFALYWLDGFFQSPSTRFEINALSNTYVRLVHAAMIEYEEGIARLREFWSSHTSVNLGAMYRSISHFESCIFSMNRAINCFRRLRGDRLHDPVAVALRKDRVLFAQDAIADRIREIRNEIHHLEDSVLEGTVVDGQFVALKPDGPEVPHASEENQTVKTMDRLVIGSREVAFRELAAWLEEMASVVAWIVDALQSRRATAVPPLPEDSSAA